MTDSVNFNIGHGHVFPRPDGVMARCGGPAICSECALNLVQKNRSNVEPADSMKTLNEILDSMDKDAKANIEEAIGDERDERLLLCIKVIRNMEEVLIWYSKGNIHLGHFTVSEQCAKTVLSECERILNESK